MLAADAAARELRRLSLPDALALTALFAEKEPRRFGAAAVRWHGRLELEVAPTLAEAELALAALAALPSSSPELGARTLLALAEHYRLKGFRAALDPLLRASLDQ